MVSLIAAGWVEVSSIERLSAVHFINLLTLFSSDEFFVFVILSSFLEIIELYVVLVKASKPLTSDEKWEFQRFDSGN